MMDVYEFLRKVPLFSDLSDTDLEKLCSEVTEDHLPPDTILFTEGEIGNKAYVIISGEIEITKESGDRNVLLATKYSGDVIGEMSLLEQSPRFASGRTLTESTLITISHKNLESLMDTNPSVARVLLSMITSRLRSTELVLQHSEKMAQLGTLTAGIAHELNNPSSAVQRGSEQLTSSLDLAQNIYKELFLLGLTEPNWDTLNSLQEQAMSKAAKPDDLDSMGRSDQEEDVEEWLQNNQVENGWEYAPALVNLGLNSDNLDELLEEFSQSKLLPVIRYICTLFTIYSLLEEIRQGTTRISEIVKSLKSYVYLDQAQVQMIDVHESIDNTLVMLRGKIKAGIELKRNYAKDLPKIQAYGSELNQVWTNLIDNAADAMEGKGTLTINTYRDNDWIIAEFMDSGPGIPKEIQHKLFDPFFTTKPVGKGTGLGLNISFNIIQKHKGSITVSSKPGKTCFRVRLPINFEEIRSTETALPVLPEIGDEKLREILKTAHTIGVVGISGNEKATSNSVSAYLQKKGYKIIPVNPNYDEILGEKVFSDLQSVPIPIDVVLVFRQSKYVHEIINQSILINAKTVWLQEGILADANGSEIAKDAGINLIMDTCMRKTHKRLFDTERSAA
jgi:signal transduction histidine kinase/predicted CoA-binding protein